MTREEKSKIVEEIRKKILEATNFAVMSETDLEDTILQMLEEMFQDVYIPMEEKADITDQVYSAIRGLGILDSIIHDDTITEVMINGPDHVFIEQNGKVRRISDTFENEQKLEDIIQRVVGMAGREVNQANPIVDTRLPDGSRVNVVLPPISLKGAIVTIRKFSKEPMTIAKLIEYGSITQEIADVLEILVKAKYNIFICGGTGSGKTTFLNAVSHFIPKDERIITIEDSAELQIEGLDNLVSLETRNANTAGVGAVTIRDLIRSSLRMRPERIIVGEVRGAEALDMLQAMNTGHDGSLSTGHANSTKDMLSRLETMVLTGAEGLPLDAVRQQIASAIDIIIHLSRLRDRSRKTMEITEVTGYENGQIQLNPLYVFEEDENSTLERVSGGLKRTKNPLVNAKEIDSEIYGCNAYVSIWSGGCEELIGKEEIGSVETIYGTAQLYYIEDWEYAALKVGDDRVFVSYGKSGNDKQYQGILEKMLPVLFTPIEIDESKKIVAEKNEISIDNKYNTYMKGGVYQGETAGKYILGFNSFDTIGSGEWDCTPLLTDPNGDFEAFKMENMDWGDDDHGEILITHNPCYYNYFFGGRGEVKIEEKASVETPYGTARIFFAVRQETDFPEDEEVAIINNYGANIIIDYRAQGKTASGIYGGRLEKYIPMMFE